MTSQPHFPATGLLPDLPDGRDFLYADAMAAEAPADWDAGFDAFEAAGIPPVSQDQGSSSSCVAQAAAPHLRLWHKALMGEDVDFSRRFIYAQIAIGFGAGAYLRDAVQLLSTLGDCPEARIPSYERGMPPTEAFMLSKPDFSDAAFLEAKTYDRFTYRMIPGRSADIGTFAHAIRENRGAIGGFTGSNAGWTQPVVVPPQPGEALWNHAVFLSGYGLYQGRRCLFTKNSWGDRYAIASGRWAGYQAIPEEYFQAAPETAAGPAPGAYVFNSWVLVPESSLTDKQKTMDFLKKNEGRLVQNVQGRGEFGLVKGGKILVASKERAAELALAYLVRKEGAAAPKGIWQEAPKEAF